MLEKRAGAGECRVGGMPPTPHSEARVSGPTMEFPMQHGEFGFLTFGWCFLPLPC